MFRRHDTTFATTSSQTTISATATTPAGTTSTTARDGHLLVKSSHSAAALPLWLQQQLDRSIAKHLEKRTCLQISASFWCLKNQQTGTKTEQWEKVDRSSHYMQSHYLMQKAVGNLNCNFLQFIAYIPHKTEMCDVEFNKKCRNVKNVKLKVQQLYRAASCICLINALRQRHGRRSA